MSRRCWAFGPFLLTILVICTLAGDALAFHVGSLFQKPPGAGGGGRIYYTGAPLERGWTCTMCHQDAPGDIRVRVDVEPASLFADFRYAPGDNYRFTVTLLNQSRGIAAGQSNFNAFALSVTDDAGLYAGFVGGFDAAAFFRGGDTVIVSSGTAVNEQSWSFDWTAPIEPTGEITLYLGVVDGNGANSAPTETRTDPFDDDVFMGSITLQQGVVSASQSQPSGTSAGHALASITPDNKVRLSPPTRPRSAPAIAGNHARPAEPAQPPRDASSWLLALIALCMAGVSVTIVGARASR